jgi:hypothetical protein
MGTKSMAGTKSYLSSGDIAERIRAAGERAKAEADARRNAAVQPFLPVEINGTKGPEPTRYGDWEHNGIVSDF